MKVTMNTEAPPAKVRLTEELERSRAPRVLVACEYSGRVREAFRAAGCVAWSCDLLDTEAPGDHYQGDVRDVLHMGWDLLVAHPPCTYLTNAGARWWPGRQQEQTDALAFVRLLLDAPIPHIALENPPGRIGSQIRKADQYVHPWEHGHMETKTTGLWLKGLPPLKPTNNVREAMDKLPPSEKHRVHWMKPGPDRWKERSRTYQGIANAMAAQWGVLLRSNVRGEPTPTAPQTLNTEQLPAAVGGRLDRGVGPHPAGA